jgi:hypothetical protein
VERCEEGEEYDRQPKRQARRSALDHAVTDNFQFNTLLWDDPGAGAKLGHYGGSGLGTVRQLKLLRKIALGLEGGEKLTVH